MRTQPNSTRALLWTVCHDLSNHLGIIRGRTQCALRRVQSGKATTEAEWADAMLQIDRAALAAAFLMEDVLNLERGETRPSSASLVDFEAVVAEVLAVNAEVLTRAGCSVAVTRDRGVDRLRGAWNPAALQRLFSNLLQNVARHAPGATVRIHHSFEPGWLHTRFSDDGGGLPSARVPFGKKASASAIANVQRRAAGSSRPRTLDHPPHGREPRPPDRNAQHAWRGRGLRHPPPDGEDLTLATPRP
jgi:K+-sensing histidine kinase KdpD